MYKITNGLYIELIVLCKVGICLVRGVNLKHRQTAWSVSSETAGDIINTKVIKKQGAVLPFEVHWSSIPSKNRRNWLTLVMIWNKFNFSLITA